MVMLRHAVRQIEMHMGLAPQQQRKTELKHMVQLQMVGHHAESQAAPSLQAQQAEWMLTLHLEMLRMLDLCG